MSKSRTHICKRTTNYGWVIYIYASRRQFFKIHIFTFIYLKECEEKRGKITSKFLTSPEMKTTLLYERERAGAPSFSRPNQITPRLAHFPNRVFSSSVALKSPGIIPFQVSFRGTQGSICHCSIYWAPKNFRGTHCPCFEKKLDALLLFRTRCHWYQSFSITCVNTRTHTQKLWLA